MMQRQTDPGLLKSACVQILFKLSQEQKDQTPSKKISI